jgi:plasmid stabilization system protein ParE
MGQYVLTAAARADFAEVVAYIRQDSPEAARRVGKVLQEAMRNLARMPEMGHVREDLAEVTLRFWHVYSYLIVYDPESKPLQIVRILHSARDVRSILESD